MKHHNDWFSVDVAKRAATVRSRSLGLVLKELLANSLDAGAAQIELTCGVAKQTRRDSTGMMAFEVACKDNGSGCADPETLRRVGSSTSDLHAGTRGRFGQGLIDVLAISSTAEILTQNHRLAFVSEGCQVGRVRNAIHGLRMDAIVRHGGEGFDNLGAYFNGIILPEGVEFRFNGRLIEQRTAMRVIPGIRLQTVTYDPEADRVRKHQRSTVVEIHAGFDDAAMIYELGIPVDEVPWELPFDINVMQKTLLDTERNMLPDKYKVKLVSELIEPMSDEFVEYMTEHDEAPPEIRDDRENAARLTTDAQAVLVKTVLGVDKNRVVRRNPLSANDISESQELETEGFSPLNRGSLPAGVSEVLKDTPTVADKHDAVCKPHFRNDPDFPPETKRQKQCMVAFEEIASALLDKRVRCDRVSGGSVEAAYKNRIISLNIDVVHIWRKPLGERTLGLIIHECAHDRVSGHAVEFRHEVERLGGKLARWVGDNLDRWVALKETLEAESPTVTGDTQ